MIDFKIIKCLLIKQRHGPDKLCLEIDWPKPFPDSKDPASLDISIAKNYGENTLILLELK